MITLREKVLGKTSTKLKLTSTPKPGHLSFPVSLDVIVGEDEQIIPPNKGPEGEYPLGQPILVSNKNLIEIRKYLSCLYVPQKDETLIKPPLLEAQVEAFINAYFTLTPTRLSERALIIEIPKNLRIPLKGLFFALCETHNKVSDVEIIKNNMVAILKDVFTCYNKEISYEGLVSSFKRTPKKYFSAESKEYFTERKEKIIIKN